MNRLVFVCIAIAISTGLSAAELRVLHEFSEPDGVNLQGGLIAVGDRLYGAAFSRGKFSLGTLYSVGVDGSEFRVIHDFEPDLSSGHNPVGELVSDGSVLYGVTQGGGSTASRGTVYSINTDGSDSRVLHRVGVQTNPDGAQLVTGLSVVGSRLFGTSYSGGLHEAGTIYSLYSDGSDYQLPYNFRGVIGVDPEDGAQPGGPLVQVGDRLYGMASNGGGLGNLGTIFSIGSDGSGYSTILNFAQAGNIGGGNLPGLVTDGNRLYGFSSRSIFTVGLDGSGYDELHRYGVLPNDGRQAVNSGLALVGSTIYGTTQLGGEFDRGTLFQINTDGTGYEILHHFQGGADDGAEPWGRPLIVGDTLYGVTNRGGATDGGTIFAITIPEPGALALAVIGCAALAISALRVTVRRRFSPASRRRPLAGSASSAGERGPSGPWSLRGVLAESPAG